MALAAGRLDRKISIEKPTVTQDANSGEVTHTWTLVQKVWAQVTPIRSKEKFLFPRELGVLTNKFTIRYLSGIDETYRIVYDGKNWDILSIEEIGRNEGLVIVAEVKR
ncbi:head-tail adaptor protein [Candidatus Parcubacteria bacterium]|nr:MAG: head-tail adaptor protein [Candidatus Parcubacteria bacterium]